MTMPEPAARAAEIDAPEAPAEPMPMPVSVHLEEVTKVYRLYGNPREQVIDILGLNRFLSRRRRQTFQEFHALKDVDLTVRRGERLGIVGRNGAGKTTLLKLITGNFVPTSGRVEVNGSVQALMQMGLGLHPEFSGYENIRSSLLYNGLAGAEFEEALQDVSDFVELEEFLHQPMKTYSLGMSARVQFAAATAIRPDVLIIDEVMGAGDAYFAGKSAHRMEKLTSSGCTLLLVSHSTSQVLQFCEQAIWMEKGEIKMRGEAIEIVKAYEEFIERLARQGMEKARQVLVSLPNEPKSEHHEPEDFATAEWQKERMLSLLDTHGAPDVKFTNGEGVSRWPAEKGLKIVRVEVLDEHGAVSHTIRSGRPLDIEIEFIAEHADDFQCRFVLLIMTLDGIALTRHVSEPMHFKLAEGETACVRLHYRATQLASSEFVFSAALFKHYDLDDSSTAIRYDLLSRSFRLKILPIHLSEPAYFHHPSEWLAGPFPRQGT